MFANNEIGTIQPIAEIGKLAKEKGDPLPHRRHPGGRQDPGRRRGDGDRPPVLHGPQDLRAEGHRRALRPAQEPAGADRAHDRRRRPRARACGPGRCRCRWRWASGKAAEICREVMAEEAARLGHAPRPAAGPDPLERGRGVPERPPGAAAAPQPEHLVRLRRGRVGADGAQQGGRAVLGLGLHLVDAGAVVRHRGARGGRRARPLLDPVRPAPVHHRGGGGLRRPTGRSRWCKRLREMSPLYELAKEGVDLKSIQWKAE